MPPPGIEPGPLPPEGSTLSAELWGHYFAQINFSYYITGMALPLVGFVELANESEAA